MASTDFLSGAPKFITSRFNSVNKYVWETLFPEKVIRENIRYKRTKEERKKEYRRLREISNEAAILVFIFLLNKFFIEGSKAAKQAVDTFKELNVEGFFIGRNYFSDRNEKVIQGEKISELLLASIGDEKVKLLVIESNYVSEILDVYRRLI